MLEVIRAVQLPESFADNLNPYDREKYRDIVAGCASRQQRQGVKPLHSRGDAKVRDSLLSTQHRVGSAKAERADYFARFAAMMSRATCAPRTMSAGGLVISMEYLPRYPLPSTRRTSSTTS